MSQFLEDYTIEAIQTGLYDEPGRHTCLLCGEVFEDGQVYPVEDRFYEAQAAARLHAAAAHGNPPQRLLSADNKYLTLTDHQRNLLRLMGEGASDAEIAAATDTAPATVRRQRYAFREKAKQARMYLAAYGLAGLEKAPERPAPAHSGATMVDERYDATPSEAQRYLKNAFYTVDPPRLRPARQGEKETGCAGAHRAAVHRRAGVHRKAGERHFEGDPPRRIRHPEALFDRIRVFGTRKGRQRVLGE